MNMDLFISEEQAKVFLNSIDPINPLTNRKITKDKKIYNNLKKGILQKYPHLTSIKENRLEFQTFIKPKNIICKVYARCPTSHHSGIGSRHLKIILSSPAIINTHKYIYYPENHPELSKFLFKGPFARHEPTSELILSNYLDHLEFLRLHTQHVYLDGKILMDKKDAIWISYPFCLDNYNIESIFDKNINERTQSIIFPSLQFNLTEQLLFDLICLHLLGINIETAYKSMILIDSKPFIFNIENYHKKEQPKAYLLQIFGLDSILHCSHIKDKLCELFSTQKEEINDIFHL